MAPLHRFVSAKPHDSLGTVKYPCTPDRGYQTEELFVRRSIPKLNCLVAALLAWLGPALQPDLAAEELKTLWVAHRQVDCVGVTPQKCYLIKETQYEDWRFWYGDIEGFDYEEGYAYEIRVLEHRIDDPAADAPAIELELIEVVLKVETDTGIVPAMPATAPPPPTLPPSPATPARTPETTVREGAAVIASESFEEPQPAIPPPPPGTRPPAPLEAPEQRGHLTIGSGIETRSFKPCGEEESLWIEDRTEAANLWQIYRDLAGYFNRPVYMVVRGRITDPPPTGFGAHYGRQLLVEELRHAAAESAGCFDDVDEYAFRAHGNEPFWSLEVARRGLSLSRMGVEGKILFPHHPPTFLENRIFYRSQTAGSRPRTLVVKLERRPCRDTMADATFSLAATIELDGDTLVGCAVEGTGQP